MNPTCPMARSLTREANSAGVSPAPILNWKGRSNSDGDAYKLRVNPSHEALSGIIGRMSRRGAGEQMPPVGTEVVDTAGLATVRNWIESLDATSCDTSGDQCL